MMTFMPGQRVGIGDGEDLVVLVSNHDHLRAFFEALLRALPVGFAFSATLRVANVAIYGFGGIPGKRDAGVHEHHCKTKKTEERLSHRKNLLSCDCTAKSR